MDFKEQGLPWNGLILEKTLEEHGNFELCAPLHQFADEQAQIARDVVRLQHVNRQPNDINCLDFIVCVENRLSDLQSDFFNTQVHRWVF